jgi:two-component system, chemotaxis family, CheB/CheR fusion protein
MLDDIKNKTKILSKNLFPVVGIGASAGGLDAFKELIKAIPKHSGIAYIMVQHLDPDHSSALPAILQKDSIIPVQKISDNVKVEPDHVYVIPSNKLLVATDGILKLSPRPSSDQKNMPIDIFFSSLAEVHQSHAIGIVLSGNGADGTQGLKNIKEQGGITFAEDPETAAYDSMPESAIKSGVVDFILPPAEMPRQLMQLNDTFALMQPGGGHLPESIPEESFRQILSLVHISSGVDFTYYKQPTIRRRILRRIIILKLKTISDYLGVLKKDKIELDNLFQDLLIPVTSFFRDAKIFEDLCKQILPELIRNKSSDKNLRIWVAGCSNGKEAYSIAMCLHEYLGDTLASYNIQIFATDISVAAIEKARAGIYDEAGLYGLSTSRIQRYFIKNNGNYYVKKAIRDMCIFAAHNFLKDPPFAKVDLVSCRNVLIYLEPFLQKKALTVFHYALNTKGYLWLGKSESIGSSSEYFMTPGTKDKFFIRKTFAGKYANPIPGPFKIVEAIGILDQKSERKENDFQKDAEDILLSKYTPPGVIVNEQLDVVQFLGSTGDFLEAASGRASMNILSMAREGLSFEIRSALQKAKKTRAAFSKENISIRNGEKIITLDVIPLLNTADLHFLVLFKSNGPLKGKKATVENRLPPNGLQQGPEKMLIKQLEKDLALARKDMRGITEEQEAANEELQSANEELLSGSEELQSLNEELETSKEELQSTNEELITVNQEMYERNEQIGQEKLFAETIVSTIHEPLLILTHDFRIKSANHSFYKNYLLTKEETIGKTLFDLQNKGWEIPGLRKELLKIQDDHEKLVELELSFNFPKAGMRTIRFNAQPVQKENKENLILLALDDITTSKDLEKIAVKNTEDIKIILENIPQITSTASADGAITYFNQNFLDYSGMNLAEAIGWGWVAVIEPGMLATVNKAWKHSITTGDIFNMEILLKRKADNTYRWHLCRSTAILNPEGKIISWVGAAIDIHEQKTKERIKDEFIAIASHELKTPLTTAKAYIQLLQMSMEETKYKDLGFAKKAAASIDRLNELIGELMDVSKIQNGKLDLNITSFDFNEMVVEAVEGIQYGALLHNIKLSGKVKEPVKADKERLKQVIINLLSNAVKYSPGSKNIFVHIGSKNGSVSVSVRDTGIGIRKESLEKIFERYYREEQRAVHFQGLGIGLFISYEIVQRHNGKIWAESIPGKGTTFHFTIPKSL